MSVLNSNIKIKALKILHKHLCILLLSTVCLLAWGCKSKKDKPKVKFMKNLTAHYNIYFNAKESLEESKATIRNAQEDDFSQLLDIFPLPNAEVSANETGNLDEVIKRANLIAIEKYESNWLDDSYLLLADAEYLKADYYNSLEYYSYVGQTFTKEKKNKLKAYLGQVKSDFALDLITEADSVLNMAVALNYKYKRDEVAATQAKLAIVKKDVKDAIKHLKNAVSLTKSAYHKTRWRYILAQLQEIDGDTESAISNYDKIAKSNTSFEMAFNANLSKIRISENADGKAFDKIATLKKLLKEDKNRQLKDQIYYQIAKAYAERKEYSAASKFYITAAHTVPGTTKQKGLTYLKLAELNFETLKNYTKSQLYYDSTLQFLPKNYPNYTSIATKANNLKYLAERLTIIDNEKNSLYLATLSDEQITTRADSIFAESEKTTIKSTQNNAPTQLVSINDYSSANKTAGTFYFYNDAAMGQGFSEFKRRWGNRNLTDNWRVSAENMLASSANNGLNPSENDADASTPMFESRDSIKAKLVRTIPYTLQAKQNANGKISTALYEIALFYKDVLKDETEAAEAFQAVIENFPDDKNLANIYYQLYRLSAASNPTQSAVFKQKILTQYPNSIYAKAIGEPNFGKEREFRLNDLNDEYAGVYQLYTAKKYGEVLSRLNNLKPRYSTFKEIEPTFAYLEALSIGHTQKTPVFLASLNQILKSFPDNESVTPIAKHQIEFIAKNRTVFDQRPTALLAHDDNEYNYNQPQLVFAPTVKEEPAKPAIIKEEVEKPEPKPVAPSIPIVIPKPEVAQVEKKVVTEKPIVNPEPELEPEVAKVVEAPKPVIVEKVPEPVPIKPKELEFSTNERQRHLIVIDISDPKQNIAQPFSKLSRYFYSKFDPSEVKLVIRVVGGTEKFVIISGDFYTREQVEIVSDELSKNLPQIMEGQTTQYTQFVVSEENLKLLTDKKSIDQYLKSIIPNK